MFIYHRDIFVKAFKSKLPNKVWKDSHKIASLGFGEYFRRRRILFLRAREKNTLIISDLSSRYHNDRVQYLIVLEDTGKKFDAVGRHIEENLLMVPLMIIEPLEQAIIELENG